MDNEDIVGIKQACTQDFSLGADPEAVYSSCLILTRTFYVTKPYHKYKHRPRITFLASAFI
jgi:hypothetical protein